MSIDPVHNGHIVIASRSHFKNVTTDEDTALSLFQVAVNIARRIPQPCVIRTNIGKEAGQTILHAHVHVIPCPEGTMGHVTFPKLGSKDPEDLEREAEKYRRFLAR